MKIFDLKALNRALYIIKKIEDLTQREAFIVGGAVRDYILNVYTNDFDIAINILSARVYHSRFFKENFKLISFNSYYKSLKVIDKSSGIKFEFTPMRLEQYPSKFNPRVRFVNSIKRDYLRRDFTINSLYMDKDKNIIDPIGAINDLKKNVLRLNQTSLSKISEDPRRILRGIKFVNKYQLKLDKSTFYILKSTKNYLNLVSKSYKMSILYDILKDISLRGIEFIKSLDLFRIDYSNFNINALSNIKDLDLRLFAILYMYNNDKDNFLSRLNSLDFISKRNIRLFKDLDFYLNRIEYDLYEVISSILDKYGFLFLRDFYEVCRILNDYYILSVKIDKFSKIIHNIERGKLPLNRREINVNGEDLISIGFKRGPQIGEIIKALNILILKGEKNDKDNLLKLALELKSQRRYE